MSSIAFLPAHFKPEEAYKIDRVLFSRGNGSVGQFRHDVQSVVWLVARATQPMQFQRFM